MTKRLYYDNASLQKFTAQVTARQQTERGLVICLDSTAFYPTSGGQSHDTGTLNGITVSDVWEDEDGKIWHLLEEPLDVDKVVGLINWKRRFDHMQQHTGQHLLSAVFVNVFNAHTLSFHLGKDTSSIDVDIPELTWQDAFRVEDQVNGIIWENHPVGVHFFDQDEIQRIPLRKPPQVKGTIRVIWIKGHDASACGGTHVRSTAEVGLLKITDLERYKGGMRVTFLCGERALKNFRRTLRLLQETSTDLSVHQDELYEAVDRLQEEHKQVRKELNTAIRELMEYHAENLWSNTPTQDGVRYIGAYWEDRSFAEARQAASILHQRQNIIVLLAVSEGESVKFVCARSDDLTGLDATVILQKALGTLGGRGGGSEILAQGGAPIHPSKDVISALEKAIDLAKASKRPDHDL